MFHRAVVFATIICLWSGLVEAQGLAIPQPRVRITGARTYEIPDVLKVDGDQLSGRVALTTDDLTVRLVLDTGQELFALKPGKRLVGRAVDVKDRVVTFLRDGNSDTIGISLDSIGSVEVSEHRSGRHILRGILAGVGAFYGTGYLIFAAGCGLNCSNAVFIPAIASGIAIGSITGRRREKWNTMPAWWLSAQFSGNRSDGRF